MSKKSHKNSKFDADSQNHAVALQAAENLEIVVEPSNGISNDTELVKVLALQSPAFLPVSNAHQIAEAIGYDGSFETEVIIAGIKHFQAVASYSMFEVGKRLLVLKEVTPHGDFLIAIEKLEISKRSAQRIMNATLRLTGLGNNSATLLQLSSSKLIELLVEDDDTLKELADGGSIIGLSLDEIERTPTRILRKKLREKQEDNTVLQTRNEKLATDNNRLLNQIEKLKTRELTHDDVELARQRDCQLLRKNLGNSLQKLTEQSEIIQAILSDFWANGESLDHATVESARDLLNLFGGSWHHLQNQFEVGMANWQQHPMTGN